MSKQMKIETDNDGLMWLMDGETVVCECFGQGDDSDDYMIAEGYVDVLDRYPTADVQRGYYWLQA